MARGAGRKNDREVFSYESIRLRNKPKVPTAPHKGTYEVYIRNNTAWKLDENGIETPLGLFISEETTTGGDCCTVLDPTITTDGTPTPAYTETLFDDHTYTFSACVTAKRLDAGTDESGQHEVTVNVKRRNGGAATIVGDIFQGRKSGTDKDWEITWAVSGNDVILHVIGVAGKEIKWQPILKRVVTS